MTYSASLQTRLRGGGISPPKIPAKKPWYQYFLEGMTEVGEAVATPFQAVGAAVSSPFLTRGGPTTGKLLEDEIARKVQEVRARGGDPTTDPELVELRRKAAAETRQTLLPGGAIQARYQERVPMGAQLAIETVATAPLLMATSPLSGFRALAPAAKLGSPAARAGQVLLAAPAAVEFGLEQAIKLPFRGIRYAFIGMRKPFMKVAEAGGKGLEREFARASIGYQRQLTLLDKLHNHPARLKGTYQSTREEFRQYTTELKAYVKEFAPEFESRLNSQLREVEEGDRALAGIGFDELLGRLHENATDIQREFLQTAMESRSQLFKLSDLLKRPRAPKGLVTAEEAAEQASRESVFMLKGALNQAVEVAEPVEARTVELLSSMFPSMKNLREVLTNPKGNKAVAVELQEQAAGMLKAVTRGQPVPKVKTGTPYRAVVYHGVAKQPGFHVEAWGDAPKGYWTNKLWAAKAYATGTPDTKLKGEALDKLFKETGGFVQEKEAYIHNPLVVNDEGEVILREVARRAANRAANKGLDPVAQNEAAGLAVRKFVEKQGHDGLIVKTIDGYLEIIPYGAAVDTSMTRGEIVRMVTEAEGPLAGRATDRLMRRGIQTVDAHGTPGKNFQVQIGLGKPTEVAKPSAPKVKKPSQAEINGWVSKGYTKEDVESLSAMTPELRELTTHQARMTGFRNVSNEAVDDYLQKVLKLAKSKKNQKAIEDIESAIEANDSGHLQNAVTESESALNAIHMDEIISLRETQRVAWVAENFPVAQTRREPKNKLVASFERIAKQNKRFDIIAEPAREGIRQQYRLNFNIEGLPTSEAAQMVDDIFKQIGRQGKPIEIFKHTTPAKGITYLGGDPGEGVYLQAEKFERTRAAHWLIKTVRAAKPRKTWEEVAEARRIEHGRRAAAAREILEKSGLRGEARIIKAREAVRGAMPKPEEFELPANLHENDKMVAALYNTIAETEKIPTRLTYQRFNAQDALNTIMIDHRLPNRSGIILLGKVFGEELAESLLDLRPLSEKMMELFLDTINIPKALLASWDLSAPLRQGAILTISHPTKAWPAFKKMVEAFGKEENAIYVHEAITQSKWAGLREEAGLFIAPITHFRSGTGLAGLEESFMSRFAQKIPLVRRSERAYITYLNKLRADVFDTVAEGWTRNGEKIPMQQYKDLARFLNWSTGRGPLGPLEKYGAVLNAAFFSPRLQTSRMLLPWTMVSGSPAVRKLAAKDLAIFTGTVSSVLGILALHPDVNVELDPRSTDFGKLRIGDTRIDFFAGFQPYARLAVQMATGQRKSVSGRTVQINRGQLIGQFLKTKRSPIVGMVQDALAGRDFLGEEMKYDVGGIFANLKDNFMPLFLQDLWDSVGTHGLVPGTFVAAPAFFGAGLQTYDASNQLVTEVFGEASRLERLLDEGQELVQKRDMENLQKYMRKNLTEGARIEKGQLALNKLTQLRRITRQLDTLQNQKEDVEENPTLNNEIKEALMKQIDAQLIAIARDTLMWLGGLPTEASFQQQPTQPQGLSQESIDKLRRGY